MVVAQKASSAFSVELVDAYSRRQKQEHVEPASGLTYVEVDPKDEHFVHLQVLGNDGINNGGGAEDPNRIYLFYVSINGVYLGQRHCISQKSGYLTIGLGNYTRGIMTGNDQPIQFQDATLWHHNNAQGGLDAPFDLEVVQMGKVTVQIYEGKLHGTSFVQKHLDSAYEPGNHVDTISIHCCAKFCVGEPFLSYEDYEKIHKARRKHKQTSATSLQAPKRRKLEAAAGFTPVPCNGGMECEPMDMLTQLSSPFPAN